MEMIIKQTREVGTSAGVLLPRGWLNKEVVVTLYQPSIKDLSKWVMNYLIEQNLNEDIYGIYLYGSYARGEQDEGSDIDLIAITSKTNKLLKINNYDILLVSKEVFLKNLPKSIHYQSFLTEATPIINKALLQELRDKKIKLKPKEALEEIDGVVKINKESVMFYQENGQLVPDGIVYSIILRLRELSLIKNIRVNKLHSKKEFLKLVGSDAYEAYSRVKNDSDDRKVVSSDAALKLIELSEKWLRELKG